MNVISIIIALSCSPIMFVGMIPFLGWLNWLVIPGTVFGALLGAFAKSKTGLILNIIVGVVCGLRLMIGGGII